MADTRKYLPTQQLDLPQILQEAKERWLRPAEICEILRNFQNFELTADPPVRPPAGSLFLFDRKALRYFRKDGHRWRKKKDGKTVKEAHEKLKAGSVDVLHCYYAHGEDNSNFQRRSYWMLDMHLQHIVLVHYRNVGEAYQSGVPCLLTDPGSQVASPQSVSAPFSAQANSPAPTGQTSFASSPNRVDWNGKTLSTEFEDVDSGGDAGTSSVAQTMFGSVLHNASLRSQVGGFPESFRDPLSSWYAGPKFAHGAGSSIWNGMDSSTRNERSMHDQNLFVEAPNRADFITHKLTDARLDVDCRVNNVTCVDKLTTEIDVQVATASSQREAQVSKEHDFNVFHPQVQDYSDPQVVVNSSNQVEENSRDGGMRNAESVELKKLDSFGRWMDKEIGVDCDDSLMASDSGNYWSPLDAENGDKEVSSLSHHMHLDIESLGPSLSQEQLFSIHDFSPDWAYSETETKVLIVGSFLGSKKHTTETKWGCMFGEIEVSAEVLSNNVIRCQTPLHAPGCVPFYVTCRNRLACSEVREFEYREKPIGNTSKDDELRFQIRLAKLLSLGSERKWLECTALDCDQCKLKSSIFSMRNNRESDWERIDGASVACNSDHLTHRDVLIQNLLKDRLCEWLVCKVHEGGKGPHVLDNEGQGVLHLTAALGYEWAMGPIIASGISPNFRDARGRTGLHWASYFGREETVIALLRLGAAPGAVKDPTSAFPGGQTAADLASSRGHKGIAGYLAEADLTSHLETLTMNENIVNNVAATIAAEKAIETAEVIATDVVVDEQYSLKSSMAAVRKSAHAAALIQEAFRTRSFRQRQLTKSGTDVYEVQSHDLIARRSLKRVQKFAHYEDYLHVAAALKIQQNYRGWKGRKDYLKIRDRIVKIQAHVRGHQVRKNYKKVVWSVGILEKVILRWRRKGAGLRGFRVEKAIEDVSSEVKKNDDYEFLSVGRKQKYAGVEKALSRVRSMARQPEAREQYMRLLSKFEKLKMADGESPASNQIESSTMSSNFMEAKLPIIFLPVSKRPP
ncbi:PREDICTED: calmodulin-binding transcription activator 2-like [Prunus mume]|uniref:Calmodulin-binding transcription activator 2-like n=1 Tax=Prunus mume TaxID=102107 RepID=A0ABM0NE81_PRUMU|nr:PREDICTED: calmodulin-binding transcription activator 2-like [Prunus mume]